MKRNMFVSLVSVLLAAALFTGCGAFPADSPVTGSAQESAVEAMEESPQESGAEPAEEFPREPSAESVQDVSDSRADKETNDSRNQASEDTAVTDNGQDSRDNAAGSNAAAVHVAESKTGNSGRQEVPTAVASGHEQTPTAAPPKDDDRENALDSGLLSSLSRLVGLKSKPETAMEYGAVDMREDHDAYDVDWDYGTDYDDHVYFAGVEYMGHHTWDDVFDAEYYKSQFPMFALQYHYDDAKLLEHFQTVGIHEGRQGCEDFNVGAFMDWCRENRPYVSDALGGDYAVYVLYYLNTMDECDGDFRADGRPAQYAAVMTYAQKAEFDGINALRKASGLDPYVFDSELAAYANYRAWVNNDLALVGHDWLHMDCSEEVKDLLFDSLGMDWYSENTLESGSTMPAEWFNSYATSKSHKDAMLAEDTVYVGCSHTYCDNVPFKGRDHRVVEFDVFARDLATVLNP